jgi:hypothetical protein
MERVRAQQPVNRVAESPREIGRVADLNVADASTLVENVNGRETEVV